MDNLDKRKELAAKVLGVGKRRIVFDSSRLEEIKEAITKQDIRDLYAAGIISLREKAGRTVYIARTTKRKAGKIKLKVRDRKGDYMTLARKFRMYLKELIKQGKITREEYRELRKKIKSRLFKTKAHLKEQIDSAVKSRAK